MNKQLKDLLDKLSKQESEIVINYLIDCKGGNCE